MKDGLDKLAGLQEEKEGSKEENKEDKKNQAQIIIELCSDMKFFHDEIGEGYAQMKNDGHYELWLINSKRMKFILMDRYMMANKDKVPSENSLKEATSALEAKAVLRGEKVKIHTRVAETDDAIYIDLCNEDWEVIEIKKDGWKIISEPPVHFKRSDIMQPLPIPTKNGNIDDLKDFVNYENETDYKLIIAWLLSTLKENIPFPLLNIQGEQGSAKSTTTKALRSLIDPSSLPLRALPKDEQTLAISANNTWVLAYDNLSGLSASMSDSLCKMSTGGGMSVRELFTTGEEAVFNIMRPGILNGIDDIAQRPDLLDRSIVINSPSIPEEKRKLEKDFWKEFDKKKASILGALCDAVSVGLEELPHTTMDKHPRMADFALWVTACEKGLCWESGEFMEAYNGNRDTAIDQGIESDPFALAVVELMKEDKEWIGNASQLIAEAGRFTDEQTRKSKAFPTARGVRNRLKRINPSLRRKSITCELYHNQMDRTLKLSSLSSYRHEVNSDKGLNHYDNYDDKLRNDEHRHTSSSNYDNKKLSSLDKPHEDKADDDDYDNYDNYTKENKRRDVITL